MLRKLQEENIPTLVELWERSVRSSHSFLNDSDIRYYRPMVKEGLGTLDEVWVEWSSDEEAKGFIGLSGNKVEMLFIDPLAQQQGLGKMMLLFAWQQKGPLTVDVNEQNVSAKNFYEKCGFAVKSRSPLDDYGRPFPILHMIQKIFPEN